MAASLVLFALLFYIGSIQCQFGCPGKANTNPIWIQPPSLVKSVPNGKLFLVGNSSSPTYVLHMFGTPYQMGFAHGQLLGDKVKTLLKETFRWLDQQVEQEFPYLPDFLVRLIVEYGVEAGLEATYWMTERHIPAYYLEEIRGISDGSGIPYMDLVRINLLPELIKAHCSMIGAWGPAISTKEDPSQLYQLRALDWATNGPFQKFATLLVYHPSTANTNNFVNFGFTGFVGSFTGISDKPIGICEKVWLNYNGSSTTFGQPWHFVLRDILLWDQTVASAVARIQNASRTCSIFVGVGGMQEKFRAIEYSYDYVNVYDDKTYPVYKNHPRMNGLVYINKHTQPSTDTCMTGLLQSRYGQVDAAFLIQVAAIQQTGDTHAAVYDYRNGQIYISSASAADAKGHSVPAYARQWTRVSLSALWSVTSDK